MSAVFIPFQSRDSLAVQDNRKAMLNCSFLQNLPKRPPQKFGNCNNCTSERDTTTGRVVSTYRRIIFPWFRHLLREEYQLGAVLLESLHVLLQWLNWLVLSPVVHRNANCASFALL